MEYFKNHHKIAGAIIVAGAGYELYLDYKEGGSTMNYVIDGAMVVVGLSLLF